MIFKIKVFFMECCICLETYDIYLHKPISINCGHTFCYDCLNTILTNKETSCSKCRQPILVFNYNFSILEILEHKRYLKYLKINDKLKKKNKDTKIKVFFLDIKD